MKKDLIVVIGGGDIIASMDREYAMDLSIWGDRCAAVKKGFKKKTSRMRKGDTEYEYTKWYRIKGDYGGLECIGDKEPDYKNYFPPEPKPKYGFKDHCSRLEYGNILISSKDYDDNRAIFKECLAFRLEDCQNYSHPMYKNPEKTLKDRGSVRAPGVSSARSAVSGGTEKEDMCLGDGDCDECEHQDECPVVACE